ncbi:dynactin subunit 6 isoform X2 [Megachile rotundata]|uniref:dynactin subunit 6 isoform X2 n=1 Tax=Megachile rotundata TaxID=143995 RepID=UPI003FD10721
MSSSVSRRTNLKISEGALVCEESILKGDITIGPRTVIHPRASIIAEAGPIIIGEGNIIEEMATIANRLPADAPESTTVPVQIIAYVAREVELTNGCVIGASCSVTESEVIPENTIIYGSQCQRREMYDKPYPQMGQLEFLMKVLPNYHHLRKPNIKPSKSEGGI